MSNLGLSYGEQFKTYFAAFCTALEFGANAYLKTRDGSHPASISPEIARLAKN